MDLRRDWYHYPGGQRHAVFDRGRDERGICIGHIFSYVDRGSDDHCGDGDADGAFPAEASGD